MGLDFVRGYGGSRLDDYAAQPILWESDENQDEAADSEVELDCEDAPNDWKPKETAMPGDWRADAWPERPVYFVDGKDVGRTIAWMRSPSGHPIPVRLSQIGSVVMKIEDRACRRVFSTTERVVTMIADPFPWDQIESFAAELQAHGFRLLLAPAPLVESQSQPPARERALSFDFEKMRKATQNRSNDEMAGLEEIAVSRINDQPGIVDGRLEPRSGGLDRKTSPIFGVIKTHYRNYLHARGMQLLYQLKVGQRTPIFALPQDRFPVASWYVRLSGGGETPNWGLVRIEVGLGWLRDRFPTVDTQASFANQLSHMIRRYRCTEGSYGRAAVSLHPIVRAEESLGALFVPSAMLTHQFYRLTGL